MAGDAPSALLAPLDGGVGGGRVLSAIDSVLVVKSEHLSAADEAAVRLLPGNDVRHVTSRHVTYSYSRS